MPALVDEGLLERDAEVVRLEDAIATAAGGAGRLVLVEGPAGIGKTRLLAKARDAATGQGMTVINAHGHDLERDFPYGVVRQLFEQYLRRADPGLRDSLLEGTAAYAAPVVAAGEGDQDPDVFGRSAAVLHGLYWLTSNLAERGPVLIAIDDAHWSDRASLEFVSYLARRLEDLPVLVALGVRSSDPAPTEEPIAQIRAGHATSVLRLEPLSPSGVASFVRVELGNGAEEEFCGACHAATAGNPFLLRELVRELKAEGVAATAESASQVARLVPNAVRGQVSARLGQLQAGAQTLARALAVLGGEVDLRYAAMLSDLSEHEAADAADALAAADLLDSERPLQFAHPLIREAIYSELPRGERARAHAHAARVLFEAGAPRERVAAQLLASDPAGEGWVADVLREAGRDSLARGAPDAAVTYLRRALEEPPGPAEAAETVYELGSAEALAGAPDCVEHLQQALELMPSGRRRVLPGRRISQILMMRGSVDAAVSALDAAIAELGEEDTELALEVEADAATTGRMDPSTYSRTVTRLARFGAGLEGRTPGERMLLANLAFEQVLQGGSAAEAAELAERAIDRGLLDDGVPSPPTIFDALYALIVADAFEPAQRALEVALSTARTHGSVLGVGATRGLRSHLAYRRGSIVEAESEARISLRAAETGGFAFVASTTAFLVDALIERGEIDAAAEALDRVATEEIRDNFFDNFVLYARGRLGIESGDPASGLADLREFGRRQDAWRGGGNPGEFPYRSSAAVALVQLGEPAEAKSLVEEELERARAWGTRRGIGIALRAKGIVQGEGGLDELELAAETLAGSGAELEHARALTDLGAAMRRAGRRSDARAPLRHGLDLARRCGAAALERRAHEELLATGARPRRLEMTGADSLTPSEHRIAAMAAEGRANREIAQALFLSLKTVEMHLSNSYRKLEIGSRSELEVALESD